MAGSIFTSRVMAAIFSTTTMAMGRSPMSLTRAGTAAPGWSTCAVWFDYDNDGKLDLFVSSFVYYDKTLNVLCTDDVNRRYYCIPRHYKPRPSHLFHNNGNGTFTDVSKESGIADSPGKSFGAVATDVNNDGRMDLFVANDTMPNFLVHQQRRRKIRRVGPGCRCRLQRCGKGPFRDGCRCCRL